MGAAFTLITRRDMTLTQLKGGVVCAVVVAIISVIVWQRDANARLRQELNQLRAEHAHLGRLRAEPERLANRKTDSEELERLRKEHDELLRLRGQVGVLRAQLAEAQPPAALTNPARPPAAANPAATAGREVRQTYAKRAYLADWVQAFHDFAFENNGQAPASFAQAQAHYEKAKTRARPGQVGVSARAGAYYKSLTPEEFEIVFQGSLPALTNPANTIVIREKQPRQLPDGRWARCYGFADGSTVQHAEPSGNFDAWERAPKPPEKAAPARRRYSLYGQR